MLNRSVLSLLVAALALLASPGLAPPAATASTRWLVGADTTACAGEIPDFSTIFEAILVAGAGDTIHICPGDYTEDSLLIYDDELTIEGSGASVTHLHWSGEPNGEPFVFGIPADRVVIRGLDVDATPRLGQAPIGIYIGGDSVTIQNNEIRNATNLAVWTTHHPAPSHVEVLSNNIHDSGEGVICEGDYCVVAGNRVENVSGLSAIYVRGNNGNITSNVVTGGGSVSGSGDDLFVAENQIAGPGIVPGSLLYVSGNRVAVTHNTLSDNVGPMQHGLSADAGPTGSSVTIARNTFTNITNPILLQDTSPGDGLTLTATIGSSPADANTFVDSGGSLGDANYLLALGGVQNDIDAEYNNWGLCTPAEIAQEIYDKAEDPALGAVDYDPFIAPSSCSPTPTPTATPTRTPTPTSTATPIPGPTRTVTIPPASWANFTWTGASSPQTVADCFGAGNVAVMYRLDTATQSFQRWIRGRDDLSNMGEVQRYDALLALNAGSQAATCTMPNVLLARSLTIPAGNWANFAWTANAILPPAATAQCFGEGNVAVMYRLNASTQTFARWIRGRDDLSNMGEVYPYDALLALNGSGQPANCTFPVLATSDLPEPE